MWLRDFFSRLPNSSKPKKHSLQFLNIAQFMGVLNDNIFKLVVVFLLIDIKGAEEASTILSSVGATFVIPFILFSSAAGVLTDRFSKQRLLVGMKLIEICIMLLAMISFAFKSTWGSYTLLFLLSTHSAIFSPSKYAIIAELVVKDKVSSANGLITSFTYLGTILGTFLASFFTEVTHKNFVLIAAFCCIIGIIGLVAAMKISHTQPQGSDKKINPLFIREIMNTLSFCRTRKHLLIAICGSSYFLFLGAFIQLNIIPYAIEVLHLNDTAGGYLFLSTALGISLGSYLVGKTSKVELGIPCLAAFFIALLSYLLFVFSFHLISVIILLVALGVVGGFFIVPFDSFVQLFSPPEKRGQVIAANNFLSFFGVLLASVTLYLFNKILHLSPSGGFALIGGVTFFLSLLMMARLSDLFFPLIARLTLKYFFIIKTHNENLLEKYPGSILIVMQGTWKKVFFLLSVTSHVHFFIRNESSWRWLLKPFYSIHAMKNTLPCLLDKAEIFSLGKLSHSCIFVKNLSEEGRLQLLLKAKKIYPIYIEVHSEGREIMISFKRNR